MNTDVLIVGCGCIDITIITKSDFESNDSYLAQGGICMLKNDDDYDSYFEDTLKAGHYENDKTSVDLMIRSSQDVIRDLISYGTRFQRDPDGALLFTREGAHSDKRILFHKDITGKEITSHLLMEARKHRNIHLLDYTTMVDIVEDNNRCFGAIIRRNDSSLDAIQADYTVLATGGIGGLFQHSTNFRHLTGDGLAIALKHDIELKDVNYIQIHPTTFYTKKVEDRSFLISESVRGEGAKLLDKNMNRFTNELLPRDLLTQEIRKQMEKDGTDHVWEDLRDIPAKELEEHFPNIVAHCLEMGYDPRKEPIPVVPAQHYFMGGIRVDYASKTSMDQLYAVGETACNGVHGRNRLASNSLLESLVFAKRAALDLMEHYPFVRKRPDLFSAINYSIYLDASAMERDYAKNVREEISRENEGRPIGASYRDMEAV